MSAASLLVCGLFLSSVTFCVLITVLVPLNVLFLLSLLLVGLLISLKGFDNVLLEQGAQRYLPSSVNSLFQDRDPFQLWIQFLRDYNPMLLFFRLSGKLK